MPPYVTWAQTAEIVKGEKRLKEILLPKTETADVHPFFDKMVATASRIIDAALEKAGYSTPLDEITDLALQNAAVGIVVGLITEANDTRAPWMDALYKSGMAYLFRVEKGTPVKGADEDATATMDLVLSNGSDAAVFDGADADAEIHGVFADLGSGPRALRRGWW